MDRDPTAPVSAFYNEHPINEGEVLSKLEASGKDINALQPPDLVAFDQDHYGGTEATDALAQRLALGPGLRVLDVCAGLGGTSRYLAWKYGCNVVGVELTASRQSGANALSRRVGLEERVRVLQGNATQLEAVVSEGDRGFDVAVSQEAFLHITDKANLLNGCRRMLKEGGRLGFTDLLATADLTESDRDGLRDGIQAHSLITADAYIESLLNAGFREVDWEDLAPWWSRILRDRLEMYRSLEEETVKRFGRARHDAYMAAYVQFVGCIESGRLGGGRFIALA